MNSETFSFKCSDGVNIHVYRWLLSDARGVVQIAHGMSEHAARYATVAAHLNEAGFSVYANDHRGHGQNVKSSADEGYFADYDGWNRVVTDLYELNRHIAETHPETPIVLLGHSMGSFLTQQYVFQHPESIVGAALSGSDGSPGFLAVVGRGITRVERRRLGKHGKSKLLDKMSFGNFNNAFKPTRTDFDWLSRDPDEVDKYINDPLCGFICATQTWFDMLGGLIELHKTSNVARVPRDLPMYIFSGDRDPVGKAGKGVRKLVSAYRAAGLNRVAERLYPSGRHEMFNETNRDEVCTDLVNWLDSIEALAAQTAA